MRAWASGDTLAQPADAPGADHSQLLRTLSIGGHVRVRAAAIATVLAPIASAIVLIGAFPPGGRAWLAWFALVPLLLACERRGFLQAAALGLLNGAAFGALGIALWLREIPGLSAPQAVALSGWVALFPAAWCALLPVLGRSPVPFTLGAAAWWTLLESARTHAGFLAFPWATLAQTQTGNLPLLQSAALGGEALVTYFIVLANVALADLLRGRNRGWSLTVLGGITAAHISGALVLDSGGAALAQDRSLAVAAVQPDVLPSERDTPQGRAAIWARLERLTADAARRGARLVVWPETVVGDPSLDVDLAVRLHRLSAQTGAELLVGAAQIEKFRKAGDGLRLGARLHNAAYLVTPGQPLDGVYRKRRLVPFAEYTPLGSSIRWPAWLARAPYSVTAGTGPSHLALADGTRIGVLICWESLFGALARDDVRDGARLLVNPTNDAWFGRAPTADLHFAVARLRAVETRAPVAVSSSTGPSGLIDGFGRLRASVGGTYREGVALTTLPLRNSTSFYTAFGWWPATYAILLVAAALAGVVWQRSHSSPESGEG